MINPKLLVMRQVGHYISFPFTSLSRYGTDVWRPYTHSHLRTLRPRKTCQNPHCPPSRAWALEMAPPHVALNLVGSRGVSHQMWHLALHNTQLLALPCIVGNITPLGPRLSPRRDHARFALIPFVMLHAQRASPIIF